MTSWRHTSGKVFIDGFSSNWFTMLCPILASVWATLPSGGCTREVVCRSYLFTYSFERRLHDDRSGRTCVHSWGQMYIGDRCTVCLFICQHLWLSICKYICIFHIIHHTLYAWSSYYFVMHLVRPNSLYKGDRHFVTDFSIGQSCLCTGIYITEWVFHR